MQYVIAFLEGIVTFLSPCLLPMLPVYLSYFAAGGPRTTRRTLTGALGFVAGFTAVFVALGALAGSLGGLLHQYQTLVNLVCGGVVILFGLNFLGVLHLDLFRGGAARAPQGGGFWQSAVFGAVFSVGWTPCVGAFLGSALLLASQQGHILQGMGMLLVYSLGLGVPFILSAVLIDSLRSALDWVKRHYSIVNGISGGLLILTGILMATGTLGRILAVLGG